MQDIMKLKEYFSEQGILISFNGSFTHGIIEEIGDAVKRHMESERLEKGIVTDVFAVYIEQTQNVRNYLNRKMLSCAPQGSSIVVIVQEDGYYTICSGNSILKSDTQALAARLEKLSSLDDEGLKKLYKEQRRKERNPDSQGAGLGLIDIARRASGKLVYRFDHQDEDYDFFSFFVKVPGA